MSQSRGRFGTAWKKRLPGFLNFVQIQSATQPKIRIHEVDYSRNAVTTVSEQFCRGELIPPKAWNGSIYKNKYYPKYAYLERRQGVCGEVDQNAGTTCCVRG
jgi:hypothetical protein